MADLVYKELSYKLIGFAFDIYKQLGSGLREAIYSDAYELLLQKNQINYQREVSHRLEFEGQIIGRRYFDFLIDNKVIIELKSGTKNYYQAFEQLKEYVFAANLKLGIIIRFTSDGVKSVRIVNTKSKN